MRGANIVGSCSASGREEALALGASEVVDYRAFKVPSYRHRFDVVFDTAGALSLSQCGAMLKRHGMSLHIVPTFAKMVGCLLPTRHHLVFGNPNPQCMAGIAEAFEQGPTRPGDRPHRAAIRGDIGRRRTREDRLPLRESW